MRASFVEFLRTGRFGDVSCGMSREQVRELLGEPESISSQRNPQIWKYGSLELAFYRLPEDLEPPLASISIYFKTPDHNLPHTLELNDWSPSHETTFEEFRDFLDRLEIRVDGGIASGPDRYLVLASGLRADFDEGRLYSASYTMRREPQMKQVAVWIPRADFDSIHREAAAIGTSVSKLCSRWIV
jgi:hypothetical protein